jgi:hypothetical protein
MTDPDLTKNLKPHYVYELVDPRDGEVFYVGKGVGERALHHELEARNKLIETNKTNRIRDIEKNSERVTVRVIGRFETEEQAFAVEATLIHWIYGLNNLTNIQGGHGGSSIRAFGEFGEIEGIDIPRRSRQPDGVYTLAMQKAREENGIVEFLSSVTQWLSEELDVPFSCIDTSESNKTKAYIYFTDIRIRIGAFHSSEPTIWLALEPSNPKKLEEFEKFVNKIGWEMRQSNKLARMPKYKGTKDLSVIRNQIKELIKSLHECDQRLIE